jgi:hypothetical protein
MRCAEPLRAQHPHAASSFKHTHLGVRGLGHQRDDVRRRGVAELNPVRSLGLHKLAVDEVLDAGLRVNGRGNSSAQLQTRPSSLCGSSLTAPTRAIAQSSSKSNEGTDGVPFPVRIDGHSSRIVDTAGEAHVAHHARGRAKKSTVRLHFPQTVKLISLFQASYREHD